MRWALTAIALIGFLLAAFSDSPGLLGLWLAVGIVFSCAALLAFAQYRITGSARDDALSPMQMERLRQVAREHAATKSGAAPPTAPAPDDGGDGADRSQAR